MSTSSILDRKSALWILMAWCCSTKPSVTTMMNNIKFRRQESPGISGLSLSLWGSDPHLNVHTSDWWWVLLTSYGISPYTCVNTSPAHLFHNNTINQTRINAVWGQTRGGPQVIICTRCKHCSKSQMHFSIADYAIPVLSCFFRVVVRYKGVHGEIL